jgi:hypothetical protein
MTGGDRTHYESYERAKLDERLMTHETAHLAAGDRCCETYSMR